MPGKSGDFTRSFANDVNPHYFTVDVEDGGFRVFSGRHHFLLSNAQVRYFINSNDFYENVQTLVRISQDPAGFAQEIVAHLASEGRFVQVKSSSFDEGFCRIEFFVDLEKHDLAPEEDRWEEGQEGYDFAVYVGPADLNLGNLLTRVSDQFDTVISSKLFKWVLDE